MEINSIFTEEELELAKKIADGNMESEETDIGFEFKGAWVTNPFMEVTGRFEFPNLDAMCEYYGKENVCSLLKKLLEQPAVLKRKGR